MEELLNQWNPSWKSMPWNFFTSPVERFQELPTFVVGEFAFISLALLLLLHAVRQGRLHVMVWIASLVTGSANDAFFMALPLVDNFWQAQASIMLTPRMPLYIPCVYICFLYASTVAAWRLGLPKWAEAAATGIMAEIIYAPYDITGAKFLWWTWHDTDAPIRARILGAPVGSTIWVITFTATFQFLLRTLVLGNPKDEDLASSQPMRPSWSRLFFSGILLNALLCTPLMMVQMALLELVSLGTQGMPSHRSLAVVLAVYLSLVVFGWRRCRGSAMTQHFFTTDPGADGLPRVALALYFLYLTANMALGRPENHVSAGVHQTVGPCDTTALDMSGQERQVYLCPDTHDQDFTFCEYGPGSESGRPNDFAEWYTICGRPHSNKGLWMMAVAGLAFVGTAVYSMAFGMAAKATKACDDRRQYKKRND